MNAVTPQSFRSNRKSLTGLRKALAVGILLIPCGFASQAHAAGGSNGINLNGLEYNGLTTNGIVRNGVNLNGLTTNGLNSNVYSQNGLIFRSTETESGGKVFDLRSLAMQPLVKSAR